MRIEARERRLTSFKAATEISMKPPSSCFFFFIPKSISSFSAILIWLLCAWELRIVIEMLQIEGCGLVNSSCRRWIQVVEGRAPSCRKWTQVAEWSFSCIIECLSLQSKISRLQHEVSRCKVEKFRCRMRRTLMLNWKALMQNEEFFRCKMKNLMQNEKFPRLKIGEHYI